MGRPNQYLFESLVLVLTSDPALTFQRFPAMRANHWALVLGGQRDAQGGQRDAHEI